MATYPSAHPTQPAWHQLVHDHYALVRPVVVGLTRHAPLHVDREELHQAGVSGLVDAAQRFVPHGDTPFAGYAVLRIRGAILDAMRRDDWAPRSVRAKLRAIDEAIGALRHAHGCEPSADDVAEHLGWEPKVVIQALLDARRSQVAPVSSVAPRHIVRTASAEPNNAPTPEESAELHELHDQLQWALQLLPTDLGRVLHLRIVAEQNLKAIAVTLRISDVRVSQLVKEGVHLLRALMALERDDVPAVPEQATGSTRRQQIVDSAAALRSTHRSARTVTQDA